MSNSRIGVFDSGRGGEIMTRYLEKLYPQTTFVFKDDQEHAPYGEKTPEEMLVLANNMVQKVYAENVSAIVVACHTISSTCFEQASSTSPVPLLSVNEALLTDLLQTWPPPQNIGLLGTSTTVRSGWFDWHIQRHFPKANLTSIACPQLATAIDAHDESRIDALLDEYLAQLPLHDLDTLLLACTHYPVVKAEIERKLPHPLRILDAQQQVGLTLAQFV
jgi:glutamate racemase